MSWTELAILSDCTRPILSQENDYPPVEEAKEFLSQTGLSKSGSEGYIADPEAFAAVLGPLFWIARCDASAPLIVFSARGSSMVATLCKHANLHLDCYNGQEAKHIESALESTGFEILPDGRCREKFSDDGAVPGRRIEL